MGRSGSFTGRFLVAMKSDPRQMSVWLVLLFRLGLIVFLFNVSLFYWYGPVSLTRGGGDCTLIAIISGSDVINLRHDRRHDSPARLRLLLAPASDPVSIHLAP